MRLTRITRLAWLAILASLVCAADAYAAVSGLPPGAQVNNDPPRDRSRAGRRFDRPDGGHGGGR